MSIYNNAVPYDKGVDHYSVSHNVFFQLLKLFLSQSWNLTFKLWVYHESKFIFKSFCGSTKMFTSRFRYVLSSNDTNMDDT